MRYSNRTMGIALALGISLPAATAAADVFNPNFGVTERHAANAANTSGSFAAATMMGAQGHSNPSIPSSWESTITSSCAIDTGSSLWPASCNPAGMARAVNAYTGRPWIMQQWDSSGQASALSAIVTAMQGHGSPAVVPIWGQADHWITITQVIATNNGGTWSINNLSAFDGGPIGRGDSSGNLYESGTVGWSGRVFAQFYFWVVTAINTSCDPNCTSDPFWNQFVILWEPPAGTENQLVSAEFPKAPGVVASGTMTPQMAQANVWKSLAAAKMDANPAIWDVLHPGTAGQAYQVHGVFPSGDAWDYYLVPILSAPDTVIGFAQLGADDGSFDGVNALSAPVKFAPVNLAKAEQLAASVLAPGESLTAGFLTWDSRGTAALAKSPSDPYYDFGIVGGGKITGTARVTWNKGAVVRL